jgi:uncharacterized protein (TIGR00730 family)
MMGREIARRGLELVYGGGNIGLMGIVADAALEAGGHVIGVIPEGLVAREVGHRALSDLRVVGSMHDRKAMMADLADAFVALPGGFGTMEEFFEVLTWAQLGIHTKPCALLNVAGYYDALLALFDTFVGERFVTPEYRALVLDDTDPARLLDTIASYTPPPLEKWITEEES